MRIIAGKHGSRKLKTPEGDAVRPTSDRVRQAVFNMLNARGLVVDAVVIDAFCGTGALGLEALSQGALYCTFFDKSKKSVDLARENITMLKEEGQSHIAVADSIKLGVRPDHIVRADLVFLDPPYHQELVVKAIESLMQGGWLAPDAHFLIETAKAENLSCPLIRVEHEKIYGDTKIILASLK